MAKFTLFLLLVHGLLAANAQQNGAVSGVITDGKEGIPGATVHVQGLQRGAVADAEGKFFIEDVSEGNHVLQFRSIGYRPVKKQIVVAKGETQEVSAVLTENSLGLDEVVITGTMNPTFVKASPVKVEVITSKYLNTFIPAAASSIVEGIKLINGIQEVVACGVCFTNSISINGLPGAYTAILMDGMPIYGNLASVYGLNGIPGMIIDRFEVIKGPGSTLYGSEAVAGVINIITKDPQSQPVFAVDVMGTSHMESFGNMAWASKIGKTHGYIGVNYAYINDFDDRNQDNFGDMINLDRYSLFSKWDIFRNSGKKFYAAAKIYYEDRRNGVEEYLNNRNYKKLRGSDSVYGESIYTRRGELFGTYEFATAENLRIDFSFSDHLQDSYYGADYYEASQKIAFANFIWNKQIKNHQLLVGITSRYQHYDDNTVATTTEVPGGEVNQPDKQFIPGVFIQDEWEVSRRLSVLAGGRLDHYHAHGLITSPRLNLKYKAGDWTVLRANLGTGFRIVNLFAEDHAFITGQRTVEIREKLKPEKSYNAALNFNHVYTWGSSQGTLDLDGYYTYFTNKIIPDYSDPSKIIYSNTDGYAVTKGLGLNVTHQFSYPLAINLGINVQDVSQTERNDEGKLTSGKVEFAADWSGVLTASYDWKKTGMTFAYTVKATGPMALPEVYDLDNDGNPSPYPRPVKSKTFAIHNLQITKDFQSAWSVYGGIQNLLDYLQPYSPLTGYNDPNAYTGFSGYFDTAYAYSPIHGREFYLGLRWNLNRQ